LKSLTGSLNFKTTVLSDFTVNFTVGPS
jgi:hypothetical protein